MILRLIAALCLAWPAIPAVASPELVYDVSAGRAIFGHEATDAWHPASLTKVMTIYTALQAVDAGRLTLDSPVTVTSESLLAAPSKMGFSVGTRLRLQDALTILAVKSANDIAIAVAQAVSGTTDNFVAEMNAVSADLGMVDTTWRNPHGLHDKLQVTTARDMVLLAAAVMRDHPVSMEIFSAPAFTINGMTIKSHNGLIGRIPGVNGMKTGYICASGFNIVSTATRNGRTIVAVVFGHDSARERDAHVAHLIEAGFAATPTGPALKLIADGKTEAPDLRSSICGGGSDQGAESEDGEARESWERQFASMPRRLGQPVVMDFLPRQPVDIPMPLPRPDHAPVAPPTETGKHRF